MSVRPCFSLFFPGCASWLRVPLHAWARLRHIPMVYLLSRRTRARESTRSDVRRIPHRTLLCFCLNITIALDPSYFILTCTPIGLSLEELGLRALERIPRDRAIDGIHAFNEMRCVFSSCSSHLDLLLFLWRATTSSHRGLIRAPLNLFTPPPRLVTDAYMSCFLPGTISWHTSGRSRRKGASSRRRILGRSSRSSGGDGVRRVGRAGFKERCGRGYLSVAGVSSLAIVCRSL